MMPWHFLANGTSQPICTGWTGRRMRERARSSRVGGGVQGAHAAHAVS